MACPDTDSEAARLDALRRYEILDTEPEEAFDRITRLARTVLDMPMVLVSLVDAHRQWFKSRQGVTQSETPREISFCTHAIKSPEPLLITDAQADPRFACSPLVTGEPYIRFYVGVPLRTRDGHAVGTLCAMDTKVRKLRGDQVRLLEDPSAIASHWQDKRPAGRLRACRFAIDNLASRSLKQKGFPRAALCRTAPTTTSSSSAPVPPAVRWPDG
jgi:hypothetical protein